MHLFLKCYSEGHFAHFTEVYFQIHHRTYLCLELFLLFFFFFYKEQVDDRECISFN